MLHCCTDATQAMTEVAALDVELDDGRPLYAHACMACVEGDCARLRELLDPLSPDDLATLLYFNGWPRPSTLLVLACTQGHQDGVEDLVE